MKEALIIETGDILDIKFQYKMMNFSFTLPKGIEISDDSILEKETYIRTEPGKSLSFAGAFTCGSADSSWIKPSEDSDEKRTYYILSDGKKYYENELIIGLGNIREYKIKNIIE